MSLTGHNLRRRQLAEMQKLVKEEKPVVQKKEVVDVKVETPKAETASEQVEIVHKSTTKKSTSSKK